MKKRILASIISLFLVGGGIYLLNSEDSFKGKRTSSESTSKLSLKNWLISLHILKGNQPSTPANKVEKNPTETGQKVTASPTSASTPGSMINGNNSHADAVATSSSGSSGISNRTYHPSNASDNTVSSSKGSTTSNNQSSNATDTKNNNNVKPATPVVSQNPNPIKPAPSSIGKETHGIHEGKSGSPMMGMNKENSPVQGVSPLLYKGLHLQVSRLAVSVKIN